MMPSGSRDKDSHLFVANFCVSMEYLSCFLLTEYKSCVKIRKREDKIIFCYCVVDYIEDI